LFQIDGSSENIGEHPAFIAKAFPFQGNIPDLFGHPERIGGFGTLQGERPDLLLVAGVQSIRDPQDRSEFGDDGTV